MKNTDFNLEKFNERITAELFVVNGQLDLNKKQFESAQYNYIKIAYEITKYSKMKYWLELLQKHVNEQHSFIGTERFRREHEIFFFSEKGNIDKYISETVTEELAKQASIIYIEYVKNDILLRSLIENSLMNSSSICANLEVLAERDAYQDLINIISPRNPLKEGIL